MLPHEKSKLYPWDLCKSSVIHRIPIVPLSRFRSLSGNHVKKSRRGPILTPSKSCVTDLGRATEFLEQNIEPIHSTCKNTWHIEWYLSFFIFYFYFISERVNWNVFWVDEGGRCLAGGFPCFWGPPSYALMCPCGVTCDDAGGPVGVCDGGSSKALCGLYRTALCTGPLAGGRPLALI